MGLHPDNFPQLFVLCFDLLDREASGCDLLGKATNTNCLLALIAYGIKVNLFICITCGGFYLICGYSQNRLA